MKQKRETYNPFENINIWYILYREGKKRPNECQYSYFVDCTTGEIIGGYPGDYKEEKN